MRTLDASISTRSRRANQFVLPLEDPYSDAASNIRSGDSCRQQSSKSPRQFCRTQHRRNSVLGDYAAVFKANELDGACLEQINNDMLKNDLNVAALGNRHRILRKVQLLFGNVK